MVSVRVLVTGATGFLGQTVCRRLLQRGFTIRACVNRKSECSLLTSVQRPIEIVRIGDIAANPDWKEPLDGVDVVMHLAGRAHVLDDNPWESFAHYMSTNATATERLAEAASTRVRRFVFVSSIAVNGKLTTGKAFDEKDAPAPVDPYGKSKLEAEKILNRIAARSAMGLVIVRPTLVYGSGARGNLLRLMNLIHRGVPLPLPHSRNRRSFMGVENLADLLVRCVDHPDAAGHTFLASDGEDISSREMATCIANALGRSCRFLPVPESWLRLAALIGNRREDAERLLSSLVVNSTKVREMLGWNPPVALKDGVAAMGKWYLDVRARASS